MKWPIRFTLIRHDTSAYNLLAPAKQADRDYQLFLAEWEKNPESSLTREHAMHVWRKYRLAVGDAKTPLADPDGRQAYETGVGLAKQRDTLPDVVFVSPYDRTLATYEHLCRGWPGLSSVKMVKEDRIREQEHGLATIYNDWRVFQALNPEQRMLRAHDGPYWYRYPQGESVPDVRDRNRSFLDTLIRDYHGTDVLVVTHHLNILATMANLQRWDADEFIRFDETQKPINCGVTVFNGDPNYGSDGKLFLGVYNEKLYS